MPAAVAAAGALAVLALDPQSADLAAQRFRARLAEREGFAVYSTAWFGGHHLPGYSVLFPPLAALAGARVIGALAAVCAAAALGALAGRRAALAAVPALLATLVSGRLTFALGVAFGVAAVLAAVRGRVALTAVLGAATALASPVAALFAGLAGAALALAPGDRRRRPGLALGAAVAAPTLAVVLAFPTGGTFPFALSAFLPAFAAGIAVALAAPRRSPLALGGALYALLCLAVLVVPSPIGGNATRLGALAAAPVAVALVRDRRALALLALPLAYWIAQPAVRDVVRAHDDPSTDPAFFAPLRAALPPGPLRVEVPLTRNKAESAHLARHVPLARGWERQVDRDRNPLFYDDAPLTAARYRRWLDANAVTHVAVPQGVPSDPAGAAERRLVERGVPGLRELGRVRGWRLFAVARPRPLAGGAARLTRVGADGFTLRFARAGESVVRLRSTRWWRVTAGAGCVGRAGAWTRVRARRPGTVTVAARLRDPGPPCAGG